MKAAPPLIFAVLLALAGCVVPPPSAVPGAPGRGMVFLTNLAAQPVVATPQSGGEPRPVVLDDRHVREMPCPADDMPVSFSAAVQPIGTYQLACGRRYVIRETDGGGQIEVDEIVP